MLIVVESMNYNEEKDTIFAIGTYKWKQRVPFKWTARMKTNWIVKLTESNLPDFIDQQIKDQIRNVLGYVNVPYNRTVTVNTEPRK